MSRCGCQLGLVLIDWLTDYDAYLTDSKPSTRNVLTSFFGFARTDSMTDSIISLKQPREILTDCVNCRTPLMYTVALCIVHKGLCGYRASQCSHVSSMWPPHSNKASSDSSGLRMNQAMAWFILNPLLSARAAKFIDENLLYGILLNAA